MKNLLRILFAHSVRDLFKYKSFFLLIFVLILADRLLEHLTEPYRRGMPLPDIRDLSLELAAFVFNELPALIVRWLLDIRALLLLVGLFFFKQLISMWPSSDMRRMHRRDRKGFGLLASLFSIHRQQVLWDAIAVGSTVGVMAIWVLGSFLIARVIWNVEESAVPLMVFGGLTFLSFPLAMAGFSYSSKLAVISRGSFAEKLRLFFRLFTDGKLLVASWLFFLFRIVIELVFVVILPVVIMLSMENFLLRVLLAGMIATPLYSFLKMASFKFFLQVYRPFPLVQAEYEQYYADMATD